MEFLLPLIKNINGVELLIFIGSIIFFVARLDDNAKANKEIINQEISHIIKLMEVNYQNIKEDISKLERKQEQSNRIKERLAMQEALVADIQSMLKSHLRHHENF